MNTQPPSVSPKPSISMDETFGGDLTAAYPMLLRMARRLAGATGEDLVQQALLKAWANRRQFTPGTNLKAWLKAILRNEFLTLVRSNAFRRTEPFTEGVDDPVAPASQDAVLELQDVAAHMSLLPPDQAEAMVMIAAGYSHEDAADFAGCAMGTMKSRVSRGRASLRQSLMEAAGA